jgi:hypothetical protein
MKRLFSRKFLDRRYKRIITRILIGAVATILLIWGGIFVYVKVNKQKLLARVSKMASEKLKGQLTIQDLGVNFLVNFPYLTLRLEGVSLRDSLYSQHKKELLKAGKLFVSAPTLQLLTGGIQPTKIVIEEGQVYLFKDSSGYSNRYITSPDESKPKSAGRTLPDKVILKNMRLIMEDVPKNKLHDIFVKKLTCGIDESGKAVNIKTKLDAVVNSMAFNLDKGSYIKGKGIKGDFNVEYNTLQSLLTVNNASLNIGGAPFKVTAAFYFGIKKDFTLQLVTNRIAFAQIKSLVPAAMSSKLDSFDFAKPLSITANIKGKTLYRDTPAVDLSFSTKNNALITPNGNFNNCSFSGAFSNHANGAYHTDEHSAIRIVGLKAEWETIPVSSDTIDIFNLKHPVITCDITSNTDLSKLDEAIGSESFHFIKGDARTKIRYHGPIGDSAKVSPYISGTFSFSNAEILYVPRGVKLSDFNGDILFDSSDIRLKQLKGKVQGSPITINAEIKNFFSLMDIDPGKLELISNVYMPVLDVQQFKSLLGQRTRGTERKKKGRLAKLSKSIDRFMDVCNMNTSLQSDKVSYKKFVATGVKANVMLTNNSWRFNNVALQHADGTLNMNGGLESVQGDNSNLVLHAQLQSINISKLFNAFSNFGLDDIGSENIKGLLTTNINLSGIINNNSAAIVPSSLNGTIDLSLKKGELVNFEPLQKMSFFLLKKRDFSNLEFAELKNRFELKGQSIIINKMEIQSTALSMFVEGLYDFKGDSTDLVIQVPLSNLKKRKPDYVPENKGVDSKKGMSVYVRAKSGKGDEIDFKIGLFKKKSVLEKMKTSEKSE